MIASLRSYQTADYHDMPLIDTHYPATPHLVSSRDGGFVLPCGGGLYNTKFKQICLTTIEVKAVVTKRFAVTLSRRSCMVATEVRMHA